MNKKIVFLSGTRADFGKQKPIITEAIKNIDFSVTIFTTGMHMLSKYGYTFEEVKQNFPNFVYGFVNQNHNSHLDETLKGNQKKIDANKNGKIDAQDFKILKGKKVQKESVQTKKWVKNLVENKYFHNFTSKNEIMQLIKTKLNESETLPHEFGPKVNKGHNGIPEFMTYDAIVKSAEPATAPSKPKTSPGTKPGTKPGTNPNPKPKHPYGPDPGENPEPKASMGEEENAHFQ